MAQTYAYLLGAIEIDDENDTIILDEAGVDIPCTVAHGTYFLWNASLGSDMMPAVTSALDAGGANTYTFAEGSPNIDPSAVSRTLTISRSAGSAAFRVKWTAAATTFPSHALGFAVTKAAVSAADEVSTRSPSSIWVPSDMHRVVVPRAEWVLAEERVADGDTEVVRFSERARRIRLEFSKIDGRRIWRHTAGNNPNGTLEAFIDRHNDGRPIYVMEPPLSSGTLLDGGSDENLLWGQDHQWKLGQQSGGSFEPTHTRMGLDLWDIDLELLGVVD